MSSSTASNSDCRVPLETLESAVDRFFRAAEARDFENFRGLFAPGAEVFQNGEQLSVDALVTWAEKGTQSVRYSNVRRIVAPGSVVEQHAAEVVLAGGAAFAIPDICVVFRFDEEGQFARVDEYAPLAAVPR